MFTLVAIKQSNAHSINSEANYYGATHSALIQVKSYRRLKNAGESPAFEHPYLVQAETLEDFHGDIPKKFEYIFWGFEGPEGRGMMDKPVILSFCQSKNGIYFMYENFAHIPATKDNINEFRRMSKAGNSDKDDHKCLSNFPHYNLDNYNPLL